tara:strand:+ start:1136 stop:1432 length:297 start_codon:yes stop_codon:yes gene_type:complete
MAGYYLRGMLQEEFGCDYPGCGEYFDSTEGADVAILRNKEVLAFCSKHAQLLLKNDVKLKTLSEVHKEKRGGKPTQHEVWAAEQNERENLFIKELKGL